MNYTYLILVLVGAFVTLGSSKPIMVSFGTNTGPIVPPQSTTTRRPNPAVTPAPVIERREDVVNPKVYKPLIPHQYRTKIYSYKPNPNLILGTPLDVKYTPGFDKYYYKKRQTKSLGIDYRGPQFFDRQAYEFELEKQRPDIQPVQRTNVEHHTNVEPSYDRNTRSKFVPQIGIIYSSGLRYYVPQIVSYSAEEDNSIYDKDDVNYYHRNKDYYY